MIAAGIALIPSLKRHASFSVGRDSSYLVRPLPPDIFSREIIVSVVLLTLIGARGP
jgi:hypothetical protein